MKDLLFIFGQSTFQTVENWTAIASRYADWTFLNFAGQIEKVLFTFLQRLVRQGVQFLVKHFSQFRIVVTSVRWIDDVTVPYFAGRFTGRWSVFLFPLPKHKMSKSIKLASGEKYDGQKNKMIGWLISIEYRDTRRVSSFRCATNTHPVHSHPQKEKQKKKKTMMIIIITLFLSFGLAELLRLPSLLEAVALSVLTLFDLVFDAPLVDELFLLRSWAWEPRSPPLLVPDILHDFKSMPTISWNSFRRAISTAYSPCYLINFIN